MRVPVLVLALALAGCVTTPPQHNYRPVARAVNTPPLNEVREARVGEEMLRTRVGIVSEAVYVPKELVVSMYTITPGYFRKVGQTDAGEFFHAGGGAEDGRIIQQGIADVPQALAVRAKDGALCVVTVFNFMVCDRPQAAVTFPSKEGFERRTRMEATSNASQQALVYAGRDGNKIRLLYRAAVGDFAASPDSRAIDHDLMASRVIEYRGGRIEVLDATDRAIRYRVLRHFASE